MFKNNFSAYITFIMSLVISFVSGYCTVIGMGKVFASASIITMCIATVIEIGRVVLLYDLHHYWNELHIGQKIPGVLMLLIAITLSAMGVYGFFANAYSQRTQEIRPIELQIVEKQHQIDTLNQAIEINNNQLKQFNTKASDRYTELGYVTKAVNLQKEQQKITNQLYEDNRNKQTEITQLNQEILSLQLEAEKKSPTLAHIKYYAKLFNVNDDTAIIIFIVMIMLVFDTLAMYLMITADWISNLNKDKSLISKKEEVINKISEYDIKERLDGIQKIIDNYNSKPIIDDDIFTNINNKLDTIIDKMNNDNIPDYLDTNAKKINEHNESLCDYMVNHIDSIKNQLNTLSAKNNNDFDKLSSSIKSEFDKFNSVSNNSQEDLIKKLDKIAERINNNIDTKSSNELLLNKITESIDNNENVILTLRFSNMIKENPQLLQELKDIYKNIPSVLDKLNKI